MRKSDLDFAAAFGLLVVAPLNLFAVVGDPCFAQFRFCLCYYSSKKIFGLDHIRFHDLHRKSHEKILLIVAFSFSFFSSFSFAVLLVLLNPHHIFGKHTLEHTDIAPILLKFLYPLPHNPKQCKNSA